MARIGRVRGQSKTFGLVHKNKKPIWKKFHFQDNYGTMNTFELLKFLHFFSYFFIHGDSHSIFFLSLSFFVQCLLTISCSLILFINLWLTIIFVFFTLCICSANVFPLAIWKCLTGSMTEYEYDFFYGWWYEFFNIRCLLLCHANSVQMSIEALSVYQSTAEKLPNECKAAFFLICNMMTWYFCLQLLRTWYRLFFGYMCGRNF